MEKNMEKKKEVFSGKGFPTATHQRVAGWLFTEIAVYLRRNQADCQVFPSPFAVFLREGEDQYFNPDITVVGHRGKVDDEGCHGTPDWVAEVVSPDSRMFDYGAKLAAYIQAGVREYWIVDPEKQTIVAYYLEKPDVPAIYYFGDTVKSDICQGLEIDTSPLMEIRYEGKEAEGPEASGDSFSPGRNRVPEEEGDGDSETGRIPGEARTEDGNGMEDTGSHPALRERNMGEMMSVEEVKAYMTENFAQLLASRNRGQLMKAAMGALKGKADSKTFSEAAAQLCRG